MSGNIDAEVQRTICMKNVLPQLKAFQLKNLCEPFGKVTNVKMTKNALAFVTMDSIENCKKALEGLSKNSYNIKVEQSKGPKHKDLGAASSTNKPRDSSVSSVRSTLSAKPATSTSRGKFLHNATSVTMAKEVRLKNIPQHMTQQTIETLCDLFATVDNVVMKDKCAFVKLKSSSDLESLMKGLKNNKHGILVEEHEVDNENKICIKNVPSSMDWQKLKFLCEVFGNVQYVEKKGTFAYIKMATKNDFEKTIEGLKNNRHGMIAEPAEEQPEQSEVGKNTVSCNIKSRRNVEPTIQSEITITQKDEKKDETKDGENKCMVCTKPSNTVCQRCGDFYCSSECQNDDWEVHRYVCIAKPKLVNHDSAEIGIIPTVTAQVPKLINKNSQAEHQKAISNPKLPLSSKPTSNVNTFVNVCHKDPKIVLNDLSKNSQDISNSNKNSVGSPMPSMLGSKAHSDLEVQNYDGDITECAEKTATKSAECFSFNKFLSDASCNKINANEKQNNTMEKKLQKECKNDHKPETKESKIKEQNTEGRLQSSANNVEIERTSIGADWNQNFPKPVCITACCKSNLLCVRLLEKQQNDEYIEMLDKTNSLGRTSMQLEKLPNTGDLVITDYEAKTLCRARIFHVINEQNIIVKFIDIGPLQTKELTQLRKYPDDLPKTENFIRAIKLFQVPDFKLNSEAINLLHHYIKNSTEMKIFCFNNDKEPEYILKENCTNKNINELILKCNGKRDSLTSNCLSFEKDGYCKTNNQIIVTETSEIPSNTQNNLDASKYKELTDNAFSITSNTSQEPQGFISLEGNLRSEIESSVVFAEDIQWNVLPNEEFVNVYVADNSLLKNGVVSCINLKKLATVKLFNQLFDDHARIVREIHTPRTSEICLALNEEDQKWYRAEFMERLSCEGASLKFIDLGCIKQVQIQNIRKYPRNLIKPCHTSMCKIAGLPIHLDEKLISSLEKLFPLKGKTILDYVETGPDAKMNVIHIDLTEFL